MYKRILFLLIVVVLISGCIQGASSSITSAMVEKYNSMNTYKTTEIVELKTTVYHISNTSKEKVDLPEPPKIEMKISETITNITFKEPNKFKFITENETMIIDDKIKYTYYPKINRTCKEKSGIRYNDINYFTFLFQIIFEYYNVEYLGTEEVNGLECQKIKLIPKDYNADGNTLSDQIIWVNNSMLVRIVSYEKYDTGDWLRRATYFNTTINSEIDDEEFELPDDAEILPIKIDFYNVEEAEQAFGHDIILPNLPEGVTLDYIKFGQYCFSKGDTYKRVSLFYEKDDKEFMSIIETDSRKNHGYLGTCSDTTSTIDYIINIDYSEEMLSEEEILNIMEPFDCWTAAGFVPDKLIRAYQ